MQQTVDHIKIKNKLFDLNIFGIPCAVEANKISIILFLIFSFSLNLLDITVRLLLIFISKTTQKEIGEFIINKSCNRD